MSDLNRGIMKFEEADKAGSSGDIVDYRYR
jgi:hypothetical protein